MSGSREHGVGVGVVGLGRIGKLHAKNIAFNIPSARLVSVCDMNEEAAKEAASQCGTKVWYADYRQMLKRKDLDAVVIAVPTYLHAQTILDCVEAGKHLFCEKPVALTLEEADKCIAKAEKADVKFQVGYMRRFDAGYAEAKKKIRQGLIGRPVIAKAVSRDPAPPPGWVADPEYSGGMFVDLTSHDFDLIRWLMESEVDRVYAEGGALVFDVVKQHGDLDNAVVNLSLKNGTVANVESSRNAVYGYDVRTEVLGTEGAVVVGKWRQTPVLLCRKEGVLHDFVWWFIERFREAYLNEMIDFVNCMLEDREPSVTGKDGGAALEIALAAQRSIDEEKPITLPLH